MKKYLVNNGLEISVFKNFNIYSQFAEDNFKNTQKVVVGINNDDFDLYFLPENVSDKNFLEKIMNNYNDLKLFAFIRKSEIISNLINPENKDLYFDGIKHYSEKDLIAQYLK